MKDVKSILLKYNQMVPRYTSYPTAPHFRPMAAAETEQWIKKMPQGRPASLYLHTPFCQEMCWYCGCHTTVTKQYRPVGDYTGLLEKEIGLWRDKAGFAPKISHLHFGGGSPTMLSAEDFDRIMSSLRAHFDFEKDAEVALEADPRGVTAEKVAVYARQGLNRASFGIQDFTPEVQAAINRVQDFDTVKSSVEIFRSNGISRLNFDLMYGLPLQTVDMILNTVDLSLRLSPQRIALFGYAHVPWMKKHMRLIKDEDLPDAAARIDLFEAAAQRLQEEGFVPVGIDHFVREDDEMFRALKEKRLARNFQGYTTDGAGSLIGLGVSSIGKFDDGYCQNAPNMVQYKHAILREELPTVRGISLTPEDRMRADLLSSLMCYFEVDAEKILTAHGFSKDYLDAEVATLFDLEADGCVAVKGRLITVNPLLRQTVRVAASRFDKYFIEDRKRHAQAV